jgi:flagellar basal body-associated protein FliL
VKKKLKFILPVVLLVLAGGVYKLKFAAKAPVAKKKVDGALVTLDPEFIVNLAGGHYGKVTVALLVSKAPPASADGATAALPEGAAVRSVITDELTGLQPQDMINRARRDRLVHTVLTALKKRTDEPVTQVFLTDVAVQ